MTNYIQDCAPLYKCPMTNGTLIWKPVLPVDIIDISAMVTRQGTGTPPHWVTIWNRDACSQGSKFMYLLSHGTNIYSSLVPMCCPGYISKISESTSYYPHFEFVIRKLASFPDHSQISSRSMAAR